MIKRFGLSREALNLDQSRIIDKWANPHDDLKTA